MCSRALASEYCRACRIVCSHSLRQASCRAQRGDYVIPAKQLDTDNGDQQISLELATEPLTKRPCQRRSERW